MTANELALTGDTLGLVDHATARSSMGVEIGVDVQEYDSDLDTLATPSAWKMFYSDAADDDFPVEQDVVPGRGGPG